MITIDECIEIQKQKIEDCKQINDSEKVKKCQNDIEICESIIKWLEIAKLAIKWIDITKKKEVKNDT